MGGQRETTVPQKTRSATGVPTKVGTVRFHQSGDQIHFHDDSAHRKVVVPVAEWFKAWQDLENKVPSQFHYVDAQQKVCLHVETTIVQGEMDILMRLDPVKSSSDFQKMKAFCQ